MTKDEEGKGKQRRKESSAPLVQKEEGGLEEEEVDKKRMRGGEVVPLRIMRLRSESSARK